MAFTVAAAQCKKICPERMNWPGRLAGISVYQIKSFKVTGEQHDCCFQSLAEVAGQPWSLFRSKNQKTPFSTSKQIMFVTLFYENISSVLISNLPNRHANYSTSLNLQQLGAHPEESQPFVHHLNGQIIWDFPRV